MNALTFKFHFVMQQYVHNIEVTVEYQSYGSPVKVIQACERLPFS